MKTGKASLFREFHATWLRRMHIVPRGGGGGGGVCGGRIGDTSQHRVLLINKKESEYLKMGIAGLGRRILNFAEIRAAIESVLNFAADITADEYSRMPAREQICMLHDYTVILSPQGGMQEPEP
jgi:predicted flavoprotein YhiN